MTATTAHRLALDPHAGRGRRIDPASRADRPACPGRSPHDYLLYAPGLSARSSWRPSVLAARPLRRLTLRQDAGGRRASAAPTSGRGLGARAPAQRGIAWIGSFATPARCVLRRAVAGLPMTAARRLGIARIDYEGRCGWSSTGDAGPRDSAGADDAPRPDELQGPNAAAQPLAPATPTRRGTLPDVLLTYRLSSLSPGRGPHWAELTVSSKLAADGAPAPWPFASIVTRQPGSCRRRKVPQASSARGRRCARGQGRDDSGAPPWGPTRAALVPGPIGRRNRAPRRSS